MLLHQGKILSTKLQTKETQHMCNARQLVSPYQGALIVNASRKAITTGCF